MIKAIVGAVVLLVAALLGFAATKPDTFHVERSTRIAAPPATVYALIDDFHRWDGWSPWEKLDPTMTRTYGGAPRGAGATYAWDGNSKVGKGHMEITGARPDSQVTIQLDFEEPFASRNVAEFTLAPDGDGTRVTWAMHGPSTYVTKVMQVFVSMDDMVGKDFDAGLANMKSLAER